MSGEIYHLKWKYFIPNKSSCLNNEFSKQQFSDVTLVSDDHRAFYAHKYVLSTFSPYFKDILLNNPHPHPLIYLRGIHSEDLYSILQFIYLGNAWVYHRVNASLSEKLHFYVLIFPQKIILLKNLCFIPQEPSGTNICKS